MRPISVDLRTRILAALEEEPSSLIIAKRFKVGASSVRKLRLRVARTGAIEADSPPGKERLVQGEHEERLRKLVQQCPDATLAVLCELLLDETGISVSQTTMWRQLERMGITLKKRASTPRREVGRT